MSLRVSSHAIERYQERVENVTDAEVRERLSTPVIRKAADFGAPFVRLATGHRIVIEDHKVVTVLPAEYWPRALDRRKVR